MEILIECNEIYVFPIIFVTEHFRSYYINDIVVKYVECPNYVGNVSYRIRAYQ